MIGFGQFQYKLDSTTSSLRGTEYILSYDNQGRCIKLVAPLGSSTPERLELHFLYDINSNVSTTTGLFFQPAGLDTLYVRTFSYLNNQLIEVTQHNYQGIFVNIDADTMMEKYIYNGNNELIEFEFYWWENNGYQIESKREYYYQAGICTTTIEYYWDCNNSNSWDTVCTKEYSYSNGNLTFVNSIGHDETCVDWENYQLYCNYNNISSSITANLPFDQSFIFFQNQQQNQITQSTRTDSSSVDVTTYHYSMWTGGTSINESKIDKTLLIILDLLGRETKGKKNEPLFYIYDDGTVEKRIVIE